MKFSVFFLPYAFPVVNLCGLRKFRQIQAGGARWEQNGKIITPVLFLGRFRWMSNAFALGNTVVHMEKELRLYQW